MTADATAATVLDMLTATIEALAQGHSADQTVAQHVARALDADLVLVAHQYGSGVVEAVASFPSLDAVAPLHEHLTHASSVTQPTVWADEVDGLGHVIHATLRPPSADDPESGFGRVIAIARLEPYGPDAEELLWRARRPLMALWPLAAQAVAAQRTDQANVVITHRERQVLELLSHGLLATSIAARLNLSPRTVHKHLGSLYRKLGVHDRLVAVGVARAQGLLPDVALRPNGMRLSG